MFQIAIANSQKTLPLDRGAIRRAVSTTLKMEGVAEATISIAVVDDETIHRLNRDFLKHDFATDVISFLLDGTEGTSDPRAAQQRGAGKSLNGEIVLSADTAQREAAAIGWPAADEMTLYIVHGLLHLCGFDDLTKSELPIMRRRERDVLEALGLNLPLRADDPQPKKPRGTSTVVPAAAATKPTTRTAPAKKTKKTATTRAAGSAARGLKASSKAAPVKKAARPRRGGSS